MRDGSRVRNHVAFGLLSYSLAACRFCRGDSVVCTGHKRHVARWTTLWRDFGERYCPGRERNFYGHEYGHRAVTKNADDQAGRAHFVWQWNGADGFKWRALARGRNHECADYF